MATLQRAKHDGHFFILLGPSKGTRQITDEGITWLRKQGYPLVSDEKIKLHRSDYHYLEDKGYLYIEDIDYEKHEIPETPLLDNETEQEGPSLLLKLDRNHHASKGISIPWTLTIKFDELEEQAQRELRRKGATAIATQLPASSYHMLDLRRLHDAPSWPNVSPQSALYHMYYYNNQNQLFPLKTGIPTQGLQGGWRGNTFLRLEHPQLANIWRRSRINERVSIDAGKEFYWIAQSGQDPEEWPGTTQKIGPVYQDWQLWHLQTRTLDDSREALQQWLSYRLIRLTYPTWRLRIISPFHEVKDHRIIYSSELKLLLRCDPPDQQSENTSTHTTLSLTPIQIPFSRKLVPVTFQSSVFQHNQRNYFYTPALKLGLEYRIRFQGEATGPTTSTQIRTLLHPKPSWLQGLSCTLIGFNTQYTFSAFSDTPEVKQSFHLLVPKDLSLEDFSKLVWKLEPAEIPCSLTWDYLTLQGEISHGPPINSLSQNTLNSWWQMKIWPTIADSSWARITLDAESFGKIILTLDLKSEQTVEKLWWEDERLSSTFIWLSNAAGKEPLLQTNPVLPTLQNMLLQLGRSHDLPPKLANAFILLAMRNHMPAWVQVRLQIAVSEIQHKQLFGQAIEQKR